MRTNLHGSVSLTALLRLQESYLEYWDVQTGCEYRKYLPIKSNRKSTGAKTIGATDMATQIIIYELYKETIPVYNIEFHS